MAERPSIAALQETIESLRAEMNELKNRPGDADILANLRTELDAVKDQLAAAQKEKKAAPAEQPEAPGNGKEKTASGDAPRERFGFW